MCKPIRDLWNSRKLSRRKCTEDSAQGHTGYETSKGKSTVIYQGYIYQKTYFKHVFKFNFTHVFKFARFIPIWSMSNFVISYLVDSHLANVDKVGIEQGEN